MFGLRANYIIAEVEFHEGEDLEEEMEAQREQEKLEQEVLTMHMYSRFVCTNNNVGF